MICVNVDTVIDVDVDVKINADVNIDVDLMMLLLMLLHKWMSQYWDYCRDLFFSCELF